MKMKRVQKTKKKVFGTAGGGGGDQDRGVPKVDKNGRVRRVFQLSELPEAMRKDILAKIAAMPPPPPKPKKKVKVKVEPVDYDEVDSGGMQLEVSRRGSEQRLDGVDGALNGNSSGGDRLPVVEAVEENNEAASASAGASPEISRASLALEDDENIGISTVGEINNDNFNRDYSFSVPPVNEVREYDSNMAQVSSDDEEDDEDDDEDDDEVSFDGNFSECTTMSITGVDDDADTIIVTLSEGAGDTQSSTLDEEEDTGDSTDGPGPGIVVPEMETQQRAFAQISIQDEADTRDQLRQPVYGRFARGHGHVIVHPKPTDEDEEVDVETVDPTPTQPTLVITLDSDGEEEDEDVDVEGVDEVGEE